MFCIPRKVAVVKGRTLGGSRHLRAGWLRRPEDLQRLELDSDPALRHPTHLRRLLRSFQQDPRSIQHPPRLKSPVNHIHCEAKSLGILTIACVRISRLALPFATLSGSTSETYQAWAPSHNRLPL